MVVVEATDAPHELAAAGIASALGRVLAAVPGRVTSQQLSGANALLMDGARMVRGPRDALDLLYPSPKRRRHTRRTTPAQWS